MSTELDRTAELCEWLSMKRHYYGNSPVSLLDGTLEADGLAVRMMEKFLDKKGWNEYRFICSREGWDCLVASENLEGQKHSGCEIDSVFAHAVHDALCRVMDKEKGEKDAL